MFGLRDRTNSETVNQKLRANSETVNQKLEVLNTLKLENEKLKNAIARVEALEKEVENFALLQQKHAALEDKYNQLQENVEHFGKEHSDLATRCNNFEVFILGQTNETDLYEEEEHKGLLFEKFDDMRNEYLDLIAKYVKNGGDDCPKVKVVRSNSQVSEPVPKPITPASTTVNSPLTRQNLEKFARKNTQSQYPVGQI